MDLNETYFDTGEVRLHVMEGPRNGPPLVLLHGATGSWKDWQPLLPLLAPRWHVYIPDLRGHGLSGRSPDGVAGYYISAFVRDTLALLRERVLEPAVLFGHSWGAVISLLAGAQIEGAAPNGLRAVVAEDPPLMIYRNPPEMAPYLGYFGALLEMKQHASTYEALLAALRQMNAASSRPNPESALLAWAENVFHVDPDFLRMVANFSEPVRGIDFAHVFERFRCPLLLLQADPAKGASLLEPDLKLIRTQVPAAQHVNFPGSGHSIHAEQPQKVAQVFEEFIAQLGN